jgi:hypothetical protein
LSFGNDRSARHGFGGDTVALLSRKIGRLFATSFSWWCAEATSIISQPALAGLAAIEKPAKAG